MARTCHQCHGDSDAYKEANLKRCSGCQKIYYCSAACQKRDWVAHIFDCKPHRPINTADHLALAVHKKLLPEHSQTCEDYGFNRVVTIQDKFFLFGLYMGTPCTYITSSMGRFSTCTYAPTGLIESLKIPPKTIHDWRVRGVLVDEITAAFDKVPEHSRGGFFPWFLRNQHVIALAGQPLSTETWHKQGDMMMMHAWRFIGWSEKDASGDIRAAVANKPPDEQRCFALYTLLLARIHPSPRDDLWLDFGFASCVTQEEETELGGRYQLLMGKCTFQEFCEAYRAHRLPDLFHAKGLRMNNGEHFRDLLRGPTGRKSVWLLKQYILLQDDPATETNATHPAVFVDYGFMNCRNDAERRQLKRVYKAFFDNHGGDPLALHEAAVKGNIHGFLSRAVQGLRDPKFQRLMKNPYPLPGL